MKKSGYMALMNLIILQSVAKELIHCGTEQVVCNYEGGGQYHGELQNIQCSRLR